MIARGLVVFCLASLLAIPVASAASEPLTVCLEEDSPPYSFKFKKRLGGFDLAVAKALAAKLGRPLQVQWFESENDDENVQSWEANALLSDGLCDLIAGYPLFAAALGKPPLARGALPDYDGQKRSERGRMVTLGTLVASRPYHRAGFAVIFGPTAEHRSIRALADLKGLRIGVEVSTLSSALLYKNAGGRLVEDLRHIPPTKGLLKQLEAGAFDATLIELHRYDNYLRRNPDSGLKWSGYVHPLGFNMGFVALERRGALLQKVNQALGDMVTNGSLAALAKDNAMTYLAPAAPDVVHTITPSMLSSG